MKLNPIIFLFMLFSLINYSQNNINVLISTTLGDIEVVLFAEKAPKTVENFLKYVSNDLYENSSFFRTCTIENEAERDVKIEVIQGGNISEELLFPPINIETTEQTGLKHKNGTISMARSEPNSATSSFFICINDQPELDFNGKRNPDGLGFAAFGEVILGMDIVHEIQQSETKKQYLISKISILNIKILK